MSAYNSIAPDSLSRLIGSPKGPILIDVRTDEEFSSDPRFIPGAIHRDAGSVAGWARVVAGRRAVVISRDCGALAHGVAAWLRDTEIGAEALEGGYNAWAAAGLPLIPESKLSPRETIWVTRARPKVDRIACPWLIRRFVDPYAVFLFVAASEVLAVAKHYDAAAFDVDGAFWTHRGDKCSFDAFVEELGLATPALRRLALIVRGADTGRQNLASESAGLIAASLGLSRLYSDDLEQLEAGLALYDAFYSWAREVGALFFSKMAAVTFGGAYAVLAYVAQQAVENLHWLSSGEMLDGLGMAETTPGPLIIVLQFIGFMAAYRAPGALAPLLAGALGGLLATWVTFTPCFLWIFVGAPYIEQLRGARALTGALSAITAVVVGVILNLAIWFSVHTMFRDTTRIHSLGLTFDAPALSSVDPWALLLAVGAAVAIFRFKAGLLPLAASAAAGVGLYAIGLISTGGAG